MQLINYKKLASELLELSDDFVAPGLVHDKLREAAEAINGMARYEKYIDDLRRDGWCLQQVKSDTNENSVLVRPLLELPNNGTDTSSRWTAVNEALPAEEMPVQVTYLGFHSKKPRSDLIACIYDGAWCYWEGAESHHDNCRVIITHWRPLLEPAIVKNM